MAFVLARAVLLLLCIYHHNAQVLCEGVAEKSTAEHSPDAIEQALLLQQSNRTTAAAEKGEGNADSVGIESGAKDNDVGSNSTQRTTESVDFADIKSEKSASQLIKQAMIGHKTRSVLIQSAIESLPSEVRIEARDAVTTSKKDSFPESLDPTLIVAALQRQDQEQEKQPLEGDNASAAPKARAARFAQEKGVHFSFGKHGQFHFGGDENGDEKQHNNPAFNKEDSASSDAPKTQPFADKQSSSGWGRFPSCPPGFIATDQQFIRCLPTEGKEDQKVEEEKKGAHYLPGVIKLFGDGDGEKERNNNNQTSSNTRGSENNENDKKPSSSSSGEPEFQSRYGYFPAEQSASAQPGDGDYDAHGPSPVDSDYFDIPKPNAPSNQPYYSDKQNVRPSGNDDAHGPPADMNNLYDDLYTIPRAMSYHPRSNDYDADGDDDDVYGSLDSSNFHRKPLVRPAHYHSGKEYEPLGGYGNNAYQPYGSYPSASSYPFTLFTGRNNLPSYWRNRHAPHFTEYDEMEELSKDESKPHSRSPPADYFYFDEDD